MSVSLIIVESPTKVKTIKKYLGKEFQVLASVGHIKDLPKSKLGIDIENGFTPTYQVLESKKKVLTELKKAAKGAAAIYLAPDPDREGEAIAWHIAEELDAKDKPIHRVLFNDLTKQTILKALSEPLPLDVNKYEAQQTRRILDRLVGYQISPLLWEKVKRGLSAGRVQSVAVRLICDREEEIRRFVPEEFWNITAQLQGENPPPFEAKLIKIGNKKAKIENVAAAEEIVKALEANTFIVHKVERKEVRKSPPPPFTTSKLQQEASRLLRFPVKKTMAIAQRLYEGIELGEEGSVGLITYMRTDSVRIADEAIREVRKYISTHYDASYLPEKPRYFKNADLAQDAHEAIRPTSLNYHPQHIKKYLTNDEFRLYQLIWNRFVACEMSPAIFDQTTIDIYCGDYLFRAQGSIMKFPGFTIVYTEGKEEEEQEKEDLLDRLLPEVRAGEVLTLIKVNTEQKFTQPPPRFTEASLVKELEERGIGRPSTYATILTTIQERKYVELKKGKFYPTELGFLINDLLVKNFPRILDPTFTASLESELDLIEQGKRNRLETLLEFYRPFTEELNKAKKEMLNLKAEGKPTEFTCEKCGAPMVMRWGKNGGFLACSQYPTCKNTRNWPSEQSVEKEEEEINAEIFCDLCGEKMVVKEGRYGKFLACLAYPNCKNTKKIGKKEENSVLTEGLVHKKCDKCGKDMVLKQGRYGSFLACTGYPTCKNTLPFTLGIPCPNEGCTGEICEKRSKSGRLFYGCSRYPECDFSTWSKPIVKPCPECGNPYLVEKRNQKGKAYLACPVKSCKYKEEL